MMKQILVILLMALLVPALVFAALPASYPPTLPEVELEVSHPSATMLRVDYQVVGPAPESRLLDGDLPAVTRWVALPPTGEVSLQAVDILDLEHSTEAASALEAADVSLPEAPFEIGTEWLMRGVRFVPLTFHPTVRGADGDVRVIRSASVELALPAEQPPLFRLGRTAMGVWGDLLLNRDQPGRDQEEGEFDAAYVYIIPDDNRVRERMEPLYELRRQEGFQVRELVAQGWMDGEFLRETLIERHRMGPPIEYVCLVGAVGGEFSVPTMYRGTSDYPYGLLDGNDPLPEAAVGRLSFNSLNELRRIVRKILTYELEPDLEDTDWFSRGAVAAGSEISGLSTILIGRWVRDLMRRNGITEVDTFWWTMGGGVTGFMERAFDRGALFVNYRGWTRLEDWTPQQIVRLNNEHHPVALFLACNTGDFNGVGYGFTEALLRAEGGAVGAIGTVGFQSRVNYNNALMAGYYRGVLEDDVVRLGWSLVRAKLELFATYDVVGVERVADHAFWTNLMGDPGTVIWRSEPRTVEIELPQQVSIEDGELQVRVTADEEPVAGVRVGLYKPDELTTAAYTDDEGQALITYHPRDVSAGEASVTVSGDRVIPRTEEVEFIQPERHILYVHHVVFDSDIWPQDGNGDGISNPGETFELAVMAENVGEVEIDGGVEFTLETEADECTVTEGIRFHQPVIFAGEMVEVVFLVRAEPNFPDRESVPFTLTAVSGDDEWQSHFGLTGEAPRWEFFGTSLDEEPDPGDHIIFDIFLTNTGSLDAAGSQAMLTSLSELAVVIDFMAAYDSISVDEVVGVGDTFRVDISQEADFGQALPFELRLVADDGVEGTVTFDLVLAPPLASTLTGPDEYGYWAICEWDWGTNIQPHYQWIELNPLAGGHGHDTGLLDRGEDDDKSVMLHLPFTFQYYGQRYDRLTVCTNGWAAFGDQREYVDFRNLPIGSPQGPRAQLCPWWDDLYQPAADGAVFYYADEANHRFIVEWYRMRRWVGPFGPGAVETFQLILLDPAWHPTCTGDGDIIFQYEDITHEARADGHGTPYETIGIGDPEDRGGLQYGFWNRWAPGAEPVAWRSALKFATAREHVYATVVGTVQDTAENAHIAGATVRVTPGGWDITALNGEFRIPNALAERPLTLTVSAPGFNDVVRELNEIPPEDSIIVAVFMLRPEIAVNLEQIVDTLRADDSTEYEFIISNAGDGELAFQMSFAEPEERLGGRRGRATTASRDEPDELWERLLSFDVTAATEDNRILGVAFADEQFQVSGGNNGELTNYIYRFNRDGQFIEREEQPCRALWGMHDLAWDEQRLYGGCGDRIYTMALDTIRVDSIPSQVNPPRGLAVDPESGELWVVNNGDPIHRLDPDGDVIATYPHRLRPYGLAWRSDDPDGCPLYIFSADGETNLAISKLDPATGGILPVTQLEGLGNDWPGGCELTPSLSGGQWCFVAVIQNPDGDKVEIYNAGVDHHWITIEPDEGVVESAGRQQCEINVSMAGLVGGVYILDLVISHNAAGGELRVPIRLVHEDGLAAVILNPPEHYELDAVYPNPSNSTVMISFSLPRSGFVDLTICDQSGRRIGQLIDEHFSAGVHRQVFDAAPLPSGVYLLRLAAPDGMRTRKFVLLK